MPVRPSTMRDEGIGLRLRLLQIRQQLEVREGGRAGREGERDHIDLWAQIRAATVQQSQSGQ